MSTPEDDEIKGRLSGIYYVLGLLVARTDNIGVLEALLATTEGADGSDVCPHGFTDPQRASFADILDVARFTRTLFDQGHNP